MFLKNAALLFKWWWRYSCEEGALWKRVVQSLHKEDHILVPSKAVDTMPGPWRDLKKLAAEKSSVAQAFFSNVKWQIGEESSIKFWVDEWLGTEPLKTAFRCLYMISAQKKEVVSNMGWFEGNVWRWVLSWQRELVTGEITQLNLLQGLLQQHHPVKAARDKTIWCNSGGFTVKSLLTEAEKISNGGAVVDSIVGTVWIKIAPPKVEFMLWLALLGKLNTREMLVKKGLLEQQANLCSFCSEQPVTIDDLLLHCSLSWQVWCNVAQGLRVQIERQTTFRQYYDMWMSKKFSHSLRTKIHIAAFFGISWSLWTARNKKNFEQQEVNLDMLCHQIRWRIIWWSKAWKEYNPYTTEELARNFDSIPILFH